MLADNAKWEADKRFFRIDGKFAQAWERQIPFPPIMESGKDRRNATRAVFSPVLSWYLGFTSTGGLSQFRDSDNAVSRACWLVLFAAGACLTAYNAVQNIREYLAFEVGMGQAKNIRASFSKRSFIVQVVTTITVKTNATLEFPAVTICPLNRVHCGNLHNRIRWTSQNTRISLARLRFLEHFVPVSSCPSLPWP